LTTHFSVGTQTLVSILFTLELGKGEMGRILLLIGKSAWQGNLTVQAEHKDKGPWLLQ
jgi:hypothetical protein